MRSLMFRYLSLALCFGLDLTVLRADKTEQGPLENCGVVMDEILNVPDNIPVPQVDLPFRFASVRRIVPSSFSGPCDRCFDAGSAISNAPPDSKDAFRDIQPVGRSNLQTAQVTVPCVHAAA